MNNRLKAVIDTAALKNNFEILSKYAGTSRVISVIKANAYGHGAVQCAKALKSFGCDMFAVACVNEAIQLREGGIADDILILGVTPVKQLGLVSSHNLIQTVPSLEYAKEIESLGVKIRCHLKVDTGMTRLGIYCHGINDIEQAYLCAKSILDVECISCEGVFTHFASADTSDLSFVNKQFECFTGFCDYCSQNGLELGMCHCCNSAATVRFKNMHLDGVRIGIMLYGLSPNPEVVETTGLVPCMSLESQVVQVSKIKKGDAVSYGGAFVADRDMTVATVAIGYADGLHRVLSGKGSFIINGKKANILGRICMDMTICDVTDIDCKAGDTAIVFDKSQTADNLASLAGTIGYEIISAVSSRVERFYI